MCVFYNNPCAVIPNNLLPGRIIILINLFLIALNNVNVKVIDSRMRELQFIQSPAQTNIYSTTRLGNVTLIGSGNYGKVLAHTNPTAFEEIPLTSIPIIASDVIAVDACQDGVIIIGVTFVQTAQLGIEDIKTAYLNFYTNWMTLEDQDEELRRSRRSSSSSKSPSKTSSKDELNYRQLKLNTIGQKCIQFKLNFIPYHLYHCLVQKPGETWEPIFLLTGSDCRIYIYEPNYDLKTFVNVPVQTYFPELEGKFSSIVTRIHVEYLQSVSKRITMCGCEDGELKVFVVSESDLGSSERSLNISSSTTSQKSDEPTIEQETEQLELPLSLSSQEESEDITGEASGGSCGDSLVSSVNEDLDFGRAIQKTTASFDGMITSINVYLEGSNVNVAVSSSSSPVFLFTNVVEDMFKQGFCMKFSSRWDAVQAVCVADVDFDGHFEIVVGTYGCTLLVYKFMGDQVRQWVIVAHRKFPSAIFSVNFFDYHLYVVSATGLHIIEYNTEAYFHKHGLHPSPELLRQFERERRSSSATIHLEED